MWLTVKSATTSRSRARSATSAQPKQAGVDGQVYLRVDEGIRGASDGVRIEGGPFTLSSVALQAVDRRETKLGDGVTVNGMGAIGLMGIQMCWLDGIQNVTPRTPTRSGVHSA